MTTEEAKDLVLDPCKTPMQMDLQGMASTGLCPAFRITDYERLTDPEDRGVLQQYLVWLECDYGITLAQYNIRVWLERLEDWPWVGHWAFVVRYNVERQPKAEWDFEIIRFLGGMTRVRKVEAKAKWIN